MAERKQSELTIAVSGKVDPSVTATIEKVELQMRKLQASVGLLNKTVEKESVAGWKKYEEAAKVALEKVEEKTVGGRIKTGHLGSN